MLGYRFTPGSGRAPRSRQAPPWRRPDGQFYWGAMKLLLIRHGIAEDKDVFARTGQPDDMRPLTEEGRHKMHEIARGLACLVPRIHVIASSPLVRARQTADIIEERFPAANRQVTRCMSPEARPDEALDWLRTREAVGCLAAVGHEPHIGGLASWLMTGGEKPVLEMKKGSALLLEFANSLRAGGGQLRWFLTAGQLRDMRG